MSMKNQTKGSRLIWLMKRLSFTPLLMLLGAVHSASADPAQKPLFLTTPVVPIMMLNMSNDHQLFYKAYDDYSNITDANGGPPDADGVPDTTYVHKYSYFGYFDSQKCYVYSTTNNRFEPSRFVDTSLSNLGYCNYTASVTNEWSGNFLNWASMTRIDAIRKILYGGLRSTDTSTETVLERAFLPPDAHAFAKFYDNSDIPKLTPFSAAVAPNSLSNTSASGITICNVSISAGYSQQAAAMSAPPRIRVAKGNYALWASNERWQCRWNSEKNNQNSNVFANSGLRAYPNSPPDSDKLGTGVAAGEYYARIKVCASDSLRESDNSCKQYPSATYPNKPVGVLQQYGENSQLNFGLMTGSYGQNMAGGVLRKNIGNMLDEVNTTDWGTFKSAPSTGGIINTLNLLRLFGYSYDQGDAGSYVNASPGDDCTYGKSSFNAGQCSNWGNPQSEMYLESLRYLTGYSATAAFSNTAKPETGYIPGLTQATWSTVLNSANSCAPVSILQFNASSSSYDTGTYAQYSGLSNLGLSNTAALDMVTNEVGNLELITNSERFIGRLVGVTPATDTGYQLCTAKTVGALSTASGTCPDSPRLDGGYNIVGLARHARKTGIPVNNLSLTKTVRTFGVALTPALPKIEVTVPSSTIKKVIIQPACRNNATNPATNCAIVDFKIVNQSQNVTFSGYTGAAAVINGTIGTKGKLYVNWEDSEQGGDYDQDMWGVIDYAVSATNVVVTTQVMAQSTGNSMGFGYVITGTNRDGFNVQSGINSYIRAGSSCLNAVGAGSCTCRTTNNGTQNDTGFGACNSAAAATAVYSVDSSTATFLEPPLYYAAKWGGYDSTFAAANAANLDTAIKNRSPSDSYFFSVDPKQLAQHLIEAFDALANDVGSSASVATNSAYLSQGTSLYQSQFNAANWSGVLNAYVFDSSGNLSSNPDLKTLDTMNSSVGRSVYTYNGSSIVSLDWNNLTATQQSYLQGTDTLALAKTRVDWLLGNDTYEVARGGSLRNRTDKAGVRNILGDLVNSAPVYVGAYDYRYSTLPGAAGSTYNAYVATKKTRTDRIFVGSNDGMLHAFNASNLVESFAYIPNLAYPKLKALMRQDYGTGANPHQYIVDGPIATGDVYINGAWRTVLVGTMGAGGKGIYALDISGTTPSVLFEMTNANLGFVLGMPQIVPMVNGRWAVVFGNGDSSSTTSKLFIVDLESPTDSNYSKILDTGAGTGLSAPELLTNDIGQVITAYAGDLGGNMWRFDLSAAALLSSNPSATPAQIASAWAKDLKLFTAKDASNNVQPIFAAPTLGLNAVKNNSIMVYFGTGKYYDTLDNTSSSSPRYSFYALADSNATIASSRATLTQKTIFGGANRDVTEPVISWATKDGWYLDFDATGGERVTTTPLLVTDKLIFPTLIPSANACDYGGSSWLMEVAAVGDKFVSQHVLAADTYRTALIIGELGFGLTVNGEGKIVGVDSKSIPLTVAATVDNKLIGRQSWRQLK